MSSGVPYTNTVISILAIKIFHTLVGLNLYDETGERRSNTVVISDEIREVVQFPRHHSRHLAPTSAQTEFHKSKDVLRNSIFGVRDTSKEYGLCNRVFKSDVNLILHIYWHTYTIGALIIVMGVRRPVAGLH